MEEGESEGESETERQTNIQKKRQTYRETASQRDKDIYIDKDRGKTEIGRKNKIQDTKR